MKATAGGDFQVYEYTVGAFSFFSRSTTLKVARVVQVTYWGDEIYLENRQCVTFSFRSLTGTDRP